MTPKEIKWLRPGWNEFPSNIWKMHENDPEIVGMVESKKIELMNIVVVEGKGKKRVFGQGDDELHIVKIPDATAISIVKDTLNREMLQRWLDEETRSKVKRALEAQIKPLLPDSQSASA